MAVIERTPSDERLPAFQVLVKPAGPSCNLACRYCYYLDKRALYPQSTFRMSDQVLRSFIRQYLRAQRGPETTVAWQGGEPTLMGLEFFRRAVEYGRAFARPGRTVRHTIQTNGTTLDAAWCAFFHERGFLVGISIDGPPEAHDAYRVDRAGRATLARAMTGARLMREHAVEFNVLATVHAANERHPLEVYRFLRDEVGTRFIQFIPVVERDVHVHTQMSGEVSSYSVDPDRYGMFLCEVFDEWVRHDVGQVFVQSFDDALAAWSGQAGTVCVLAPTCGTALALEHNGDLYACDHYVEPAFRLGNITRTPLVDLVWSDRQRSFGRHKRDRLALACRDCRFRFACHGGCPKHRFRDSAAGGTGPSYLCAGYRAFFAHVDQPIQRMVDLLRRGRAPAEIMRADRGVQVPSRSASLRPGRNEPCSCGSGRKFKRCHGRRVSGTLADPSGVS